MHTQLQELLQAARALHTRLLLRAASREYALESTLGEAVGVQLQACAAVPLALPDCLATLHCGSAATAAADAVAVEAASAAVTLGRRKNPSA